MNVNLEFYTHLVENPQRVVIGAVEYLVEGFGIRGVEIPIVNKVLAGVFSVVRPRVFW